MKQKLAVWSRIYLGWVPVLRSRQKSLASKFLGLVGLVVVGVTFLLAVSVLSIYRNDMYRQLLKRSFRNLDSINSRLQSNLWTNTGLLRGGGSNTDLLSAELNYRVQKMFDDMINNDPAVVYLILYYPADRIIYPEAPPSKKEGLDADYKRLKAEVDFFDARYNRKTGIVETFIRVPDRNNSSWGFVEMGVSITSIRMGIIQTIAVSFIVALIFVTVGISAAWAMMAGILKPVRELKEAASAIAAGDLEQKVLIETDDEIADLSRSFNTMTDSLKLRIEDMYKVQAFSKDIGGYLAKEELLRAVNRQFQTFAEASHVAMLTRAKGGGKFELAAGIAVVDERARIDADSPILADTIRAREERVWPAPVKPCPETNIFFPGVAAPPHMSVLALPIITWDKVDTVAVLVGEKLKTDVDSLRLYRTLTGHAGLCVQNARLYELATTDGLTGLFLRRHFLLELERILAMPEPPEGRSMALVMSDIDHFKKVNDTYGHPEGDFILVTVAETLKASLRITDLRFAERSPDLIGRYGGEEFIILLRNVDRQGASVVTERMRQSVESREYSGEKHTHKITVSVGACLHEPGITAEEWIARADAALYASKHGGRNRCTFHEH